MVYSADGGGGVKTRVPRSSSAALSLSWMRDTQAMTWMCFHPSVPRGKNIQVVPLDAGDREGF